jgi:hypothetical protein
MCRHYSVVYSCGHVKNEVRICALSINCDTLSRNNIIAIPSHCPICILAPTFPTSEQRTFIPLPDLERLIEAERIWGRLHRLYLGEPIADSNRGLNEDTRLRLHDPIPEEDLNQLHYWLQLLQESRRTPKAYLVEGWDKIVYLILLRAIVLNEIEAKEAKVESVPDGSAKQNLLVKVEIEDLEEDRRDCSICHEPYGETPEADEEPELIVKLPCGHVFGEVCIISAFEQVGWSCPYCRRPYEQDEFVPNRQLKEIVSPWWMEWLKRLAE